MENVVAVFDGFGSLLTIIQADSKHQLTMAINDFADEWQEGCRLEEDITERDWDTLMSAFEGSCISILCDVSGGHELEIKGVPLRNYTHYTLEDSHD